MTIYEKALQAWEKGAYYNNITDYKVNDRLEEIAGKQRYKIYWEADNGIQAVINTLTVDECKEFIHDVEFILKQNK